MKKEFIKKEDADILKRAYKIMAKQLGYPKHNCSDVAFSCFQCNAKRFMEDFDSLIYFYLEIKRGSKKKKRMKNLLPSNLQRA